MVASSVEPPAVVDSNSRAERRSRRLGWWLFFAVAVMAPFALVIAGAAIAYLWWDLGNIAAAAQVKAEVARIQATGQPITIADSYAHHRVPNGTTDITALWLAAMKSYDDRANQIGRDTWMKLPIVGTGEPKLLVPDVQGSLLPATETYLADCDPAVQVILAAARARGECRFPIPFEQGPTIMLPHAQNMRGLARVMALRARVAAARGKPDVAIESIEAIVAASRTLEHQPTLIEYLVGVAIRSVALAEAEDLLNQADLTDEQLIRLQMLVQDLTPGDQLTAALIGERGVGFTTFHTMPPPLAAGPPTAASGPMAGGKLTNPRACLAYLVVMQELIDASREASPKSLDEVRLIAARMQVQAQSSNPLTRMNVVPAAQILPSGQASFSATARTHAHRDLLLLAIAAKRHQLKHGSDPQSLDDLVPEFIGAVPIDPFDGQPLRMKANADELVFYSVGQDRTDNGGQDPDDRNMPDIVVRLPVQPEGR